MSLRRWVMKRGELPRLDEQPPSEAQRLCCGSASGSPCGRIRAARAVADCPARSMGTDLAQMSDAPPRDLRAWEPGEPGKGFLLRPKEAGGPPGVILWADPGGETVFHDQLLEIAGLAHDDVLLYLEVEATGELMDDARGELDGRTYVEWLLELDPRLSEFAGYDFEKYESPD